MIEWPYADGVDFAKHGNPLFGDEWEGTPRGDDPDAFMTDAPVGEPCTLCGAPVQADDSGELMLSLEQPMMLRIVALHVECSLLTVLGHDLGVCSCTRWAGAATVREAAIEAMRRYRQLHS